jgi:uncharacterized protein YbjT (DUF2867 family)
VKATLKAGHSVRALARSARRIPIDHPKFEKIPGDALEMATVKRALTGVDVVAQSLGVFARARTHPQADAPLVARQQGAHRTTFEWRCRVSNPAAPTGQSVANACIADCCARLVWHGPTGSVGRAA